MKNIAMIVLVLSFGFTVNVKGQGIENDPTYSENNYKHLNKAKLAKERNVGKFLNVSYVEAENNYSRNYKSQHNSGSPKREGFIFPSKELSPSGNALSNPSNYKTHQ